MIWIRILFDLITFGEIMLRLSPPRHARIVDGDILKNDAGGQNSTLLPALPFGTSYRYRFKLPQNGAPELLSRTGSVLSEYPMTIWSTMIRRTQDSVSTTTR